MRLQPDQDLAREARAATAGLAAEAADGAGGGELGVDQPGHAGTTTWTAAASARMVAGSSAIGSPSAYTANGRSALIVTSAARSTVTSGSSRCVPLNTLGISERRKRRFGIAASVTTSSKPSSSNAPGAAYIPPPYALLFAAPTL